MSKAKRPAKAKPATRVISGWVERSYTLAEAAKDISAAVRDFSLGRIKDDTEHLLANGKLVYGYRVRVTVTVERA